MAETLEQRVAILEKELAELKARWLSPAPAKDWRKTVGWARNDSVHEEAMDLGETYRRNQTVEQEELNAGA